MLCLLFPIYNYLHTQRNIAQSNLAYLKVMLTKGLVFKVLLRELVTGINVFV